MGNGELPAWPCGPHRQPPICPAGEPGNPGPEGSRTRGRGPDRPTDHPQATRRPKTVRGRPPSRTHPCSVTRNGRTTCWSWLRRGRPLVSAREQQLFGFVGPNGAGKTSAMRIVLGVLEPDAGEIRWRGRPVGLAAVRCRQAITCCAARQPLLPGRSSPPAIASSCAAAQTTGTSARRTG
jgi:hypothetical protein